MIPVLSDLIWECALFQDPKGKDSKEDTKGPKKDKEDTRGATKKGGTLNMPPPVYLKAKSFLSFTCSRLIY